MRHFNLDSRDYVFSEKFVAGIVLTGSDVKSLRTQTTPMQGSRVEVLGGYPKVLNLHIPTYKFSQQADTTSERNLLLNNKEIKKLLTYKKQKYMLIPISIFAQGRWFKLEFGAGRKLKKYDKRAKLKDKEIKSKPAKY